MDTKQPQWDKKEGPPTIMASPDGPNKNASLTEPLRIGQRAMGTIGGVEVTVMLTKLSTSTTAEAETIRIWNGVEDMDELGDIRIGSPVMISRENMEWLDVDTNTP